MCINILLNFINRLSVSYLKPQHLKSSFYLRLQATGERIREYSLGPEVRVARPGARKSRGLSSHGHLKTKLESTSKTT